jgi:hypothetical protein
VCRRVSTGTLNVNYERRNDCQLDNTREARLIRTDEMISPSSEADDAIEFGVTEDFSGDSVSAWIGHDSHPHACYGICVYLDHAGWETPCELVTQIGRDRAVDVYRGQ